MINFKRKKRLTNSFLEIKEINLQFTQTYKSLITMSL